jgi:hypothetical protein
MATANNAFDLIQDKLTSSGVAETLDQLANQLRDQKQYRELFQALKMKARHALNLSAVSNDAEDDELPEELRNKLDQGLLSACREVGLLMLADGDIREGWMYLRPLSDRKAAAEAMSEIEPDDDNMDELIEVLLHEGVDPGRGYGLVLEHYGTCNAITTFEGAMQSRTRDEQQQMAMLLLKHLHHELLENVKSDVAQKEDATPGETTLIELVGDRDYLFTDSSYHVDTTHLASTVRFARLLDGEAELRLALDLTEYGRRLHQQFQYSDNEPFADTYPSNALYYQALLGENMDEAVGFFEEKTKSVDQEEFGSLAIEVYIDLMARIGRYDAAIDATLDLMPKDQPAIGIAPSLYELCDKSGSFDRYLAACKEREDLLGYVAGLIHDK